MKCRSWVMAGLIAGSVCGARSIQAQAVDSLGRATALPSPAFDSLGRPRPLSSIRTPSKEIRLCESCHRGPAPAVRLIGAANELLFMSPADTAKRFRMPEVWKDLPELNPSDVADITVVKSVAAIERFGGAYASGVVVVTLNQKGTDAWREAVATGKVKAAP